MIRRPLLVSLEVLGVGLFGIAACQGTPSNPGLPGAYDAGGVGPGSGGGSGGSAGSGPMDSSVDDSAPDHGVLKDGATKDAVMKETGAKDAGADTTVPPCPRCTVLWSDMVENPVSLALDVTNVYWAQGQNSGGMPVAGSGSVRDIPRKGGGVNIDDTLLTGPLIVKVLPGIPNIAWSALGAGASAGTVSNQGFGPPSTPGTGLSAPFGVAIDSTSVYWVSSSGGGAMVQSALVPGGPPSTLGTAAGGFLPQGMAVSATSIYFVAQLSGGGGGLFELPIAGATPAEIWTGNATSAPVDVAVDGTNVYWTDDGDSAVYAMALDGGPVTTLASKASTSGLVGPARIAVDSKNVYFSDPTGKGLYEVPTGGGTVKTLVPTITGLAILGVAADDNDGNVYFSSPTEILSIPK